MLDLIPTVNSPAVELTINSVLEHKQPLDWTEERSGELAFQAMLDEINAVSLRTVPKPLPVLIFLHGDRTGAPTIEVQRHIAKVLETSGLAFVVNNGRARDPHFSSEYLRGNTGHILRAIAYATGGNLIEVRSDQNQPGGYSAAIAAILDRLHGRYQIGFVPQRFDGKWHRLEVKLTDAGKSKHPGIALRSRNGYVAPANTR